jgi:hypothetical protein
MQAAYGFSTARSGGNPTIQDTWHALTLFWAIGWWFISDSRRYGINWNDGFMDMGILLYVACMFIIPYYLFKSRGWKAIYTLVLILGVYLGAHIIGAIMYLVSTL